VKQWAPLAAAVVLVLGAVLLMLRVTQDPPESPPAANTANGAPDPVEGWDTGDEPDPELQQPSGQNRGDLAESDASADAAGGGSDAPQTPEAEAQAAASEALRVEDNFEAKAKAQLCLRLNPRNTQCSSILRRACGRSGDWVCLRVETDACLARDPEDYDCLASRITLNSRARKFKLAEADLAKLRAQQPEGSFTYAAAAGLHLFKGELKEALADYRTACGLGQEAACLRANQLDAKLHGNVKAPAGSTTAGSSAKAASSASNALSPPAAPTP